MWKPDRDGKGCYGCTGEDMRHRISVDYRDELGICANCYTEAELASMPTRKILTDAELQAVRRRAEDLMRKNKPALLETIEYLRRWHGLKVD